MKAWISTWEASVVIFPLVLARFFIKYPDLPQTVKEPWDLLGYNIQAESEGVLKPAWAPLISSALFLGQNKHAYGLHSKCSTQMWNMLLLYSRNPTDNHASFLLSPWRGYINIFQITHLYETASKVDPKLFNFLWYVYNY